VPRKVMKELMQRTDGPALRDTAIWALLHIVACGGWHLLLGILGSAALLARLWGDLRSACD
jgi:hypothetical protein